jgi:hypothetical protein
MELSRLLYLAIGIGQSSRELGLVIRAVRPMRGCLLFDERPSPGDPGPTTSNASLGTAPRVLVLGTNVGIC